MPKEEACALGNNSIIKAQWDQHILDFDAEDGSGPAI